MTIQTELDAITRAEQRLRELETTLQAELKDAEGQRPTPMTHNRPFELRRAMWHLREGVSASDATDPRVWAALHSEEMRAFHFRSPGLAPLARLKAKLVAEQEAASNPPAPEPVAQYRYTGQPWKVKVAGRRLASGEVVQLTQEAAARWRDQLEPVTD